MGQVVDARYLRVKNWEKFQHYHNRPNAPYWIKMYPDLLTNYEFLQLKESERYKLMALWLLASRLRNRIPYDTKYVSKVIGSSKVDLDKFVVLGFLEPFTEDDVHPDPGIDVGIDVGRTQNRTEDIEKKRAEAEGEPADQSDPVVRLLVAIGSHADTGTERVVRKHAAGLSEGDVAFARECCEGPGVTNRAKVAVDALKKRRAA